MAIIIALQDFFLEASARSNGLLSNLNVLLISIIGAVFLRWTRRWGYTSFLWTLFAFSILMLLLQGWPWGQLFALGVFTTVTEGLVRFYCNWRLPRSLVLILLISIYLGFRLLDITGTIWMLGGVSLLFIRSVEIVFNPQGAPLPVRLSYLSHWLVFQMGPIQRFKSYFEQEQSFHYDLSARDFGRFVTGLMKVVWLAPLLGSASENLSLSTTFSKLSALFIYLNFFRIYFEFSGYMDCVLVLGKVFGLSLPENFNRPYFAQNIVEFWQRWHITLTTWLRDIVFFPSYSFFLKSRRFADNIAVGLSYLLVSMSMALLHGITLNWLLYGLWNGLGLIAFQLFNSYNSRIGTGRNPTYLIKFNRMLGRFITLTFVSIGFLFMDGIDSFILFLGILTNAL